MSKLTIQAIVWICEETPVSEVCDDWLEVSWKHSSRAWSEHSSGRCPGNSGPDYAPPLHCSTPSVARNWNIPKTLRLSSHHCELCRLWAGHFLGCSVQCCLWQSAVVLLSVVSLASVVCLFSKYAHIKHLKSNVCQYLMSPYLTCFAVPSMPTNKATTVNYYSNWLQINLLQNNKWRDLDMDLYDWNDLDVTFRGCICR